MSLSSFGCSARNASLRWTSSGRSRSSAWSVFFSREVRPLERVADGRMAGPDAALLFGGLLQLDDHRVVTLADQPAERIECVADRRRNAAPVGTPHNAVGLALQPPPVVDRVLLIPKSTAISRTVPTPAITRTRLDRIPT